MVKNLPANAGDAGSILGQEDALEKEMATHSSILAWKTPWTEEHGGLIVSKSRTQLMRLNNNKTEKSRDCN